MSAYRYKYTHKKAIYQEGISHNLDQLRFGSFGLISTSTGQINSKQIEAARVAINRKIKKLGTIWIRIKPNRPITKKSAGVRMGKGKGAVSHWIYFAKKDEILFELEGTGISTQLAQEALLLGASKLAVSSRFIHNSN